MQRESSREVQQEVEVMCVQRVEVAGYKVVGIMKYFKGANRFASPCTFNLLI